MTAPFDPAQIQAFLAWQAAQVPVDTVPDPTIGDLLRMLVNSARLPSETVVRSWHDVVDTFEKDLSLVKDILNGGSDSSRVEASSTSDPNPFT